MGVGEETLPQALSKCEDCGAVLANLGGHDCDAQDPSSKTNPTRDEREALIERDTRPDSTDVLLSNSGRSYHETDADKKPFCGLGKKGKMRPTERGYAKKRGKSPCQLCEKKQREMTDEMAERPGDDCTTCHFRVCHVCQGRSGGPRGPIEEREKHNGHFVCHTCYNILESLE